MLRDKSYHEWMNLILTATEIVFVSILSWFETIKSLLHLFMMTEHEMVPNKPNQTCSYLMNTTWAQLHELQ